jgi:HEAT repeat protein
MRYSKRRLCLHFVLLAAVWPALASEIAQNPFDRPGPKGSPKTDLRLEEFYRGGMIDYDASLLPKVVKYLYSDDPQILCEACGIVGYHPGQRLAVPRLTQLLSHADADVRRAAAGGLVDIGIIDDEVASAALKRLGVEEETLPFISLLELLEKYKGKKVDVVSSLVACLNSHRGGSPDQEWVAALIGRMHPDPKGRIAASAAHAIATIVREAPSGRLSSVYALGELGVASHEVVSALQRALRELSPIKVTAVPDSGALPPWTVEVTVAGAAAEALGKLGDASKPAIPEMEALLKGDSLTHCDRLSVVGALAILGQHDADRIGMIVRHLDLPTPSKDRSGMPTKDGLESVYMRREAVHLLGRLGVRARVAVPKLRELESRLGHTTSTVTVIQS